MSADESTKIDIYLASPLTDPNPNIMLGRYYAVVRAAAFIKSKGFSTFCPVAHGYTFTKFDNKIQHTWATWKTEDAAILSVCRMFIVLKLPGWDESIGLKAEWALAEKMGLAFGSMRLQCGVLCDIHLPLRPLAEMEFSK